MTFLPPVARFVSASGVRIYRIGCRVYPHLTARVFLLLGAGEPTLIDVGSGEGSSTTDILAGIDEVRDRFGERIAVDDIRRIILTHGHIDHFGGLADLLALLGDNVEVGVHALDREAVISDDHWAIGADDRLHRFLATAGLDAQQRLTFMNHYRHPGSTVVVEENDSSNDNGHRTGRSAVCRIDNELRLEDGMALDRLQFIHTPGHSPGSVCILIDDVLLTGDHILPRTLPQQWPESVASFTGLRHYMSSLQKIERIKGIRLAAGGHEPVMTDVYHRIDEIHRSQNRRFKRVQDVVHNSPERLTLQEIGRRVYTQAEGFFAFLALTDVAARVEHLEEHGKLRVEHDQGVAWVSGV